MSPPYLGEEHSELYRRTQPKTMQKTVPGSPAHKEIPIGEFGNRIEDEIVREPLSVNLITQQQSQDTTELRSHGIQFPGNAENPRMQADRKIW